MGPTKPLLIVLALLAAGSARGDGAEKGARTLCRASERPVFSCSTGRKTISVCASPDLSASAGHLTYRFGRSRRSIELSYPADNEHPRHHFRFHGDDSGYDADQQLSFSVGSFTYIVFVRYLPFDVTEDGVVVKSGSRRLARFGCSETAVARLYSLKGLGLPAAQYEDVEPAR